MTGIPDCNPPERAARLREVVEILDQMLRNEITTYQGRYYRVEDAEMHPAPLQRPRPPLTLAALGSKSLKIAARYADSWNSLTDPGLSAKKALETTRERNEMLDEYCAQIDRDTGEITRSLLVWTFIPETPFDSNDAFRDLVGRYREAGKTSSSSTGYERKPSNMATIGAWSNAARTGRRSNAWPQK